MVEAWIDAFNVVAKELQAENARTWGWGRRRKNGKSS